MRTYLILIFAIVISGCRSNSKPPQLGDITGIGAGNWSKEYRNKVMKDCIDKASEKLSVSDAFSYCDCMTKKAEAQYPDENEVDLSKEDIESMRSICLPSNTAQSIQPDQSNNPDAKGWSVADKREFMDNCIPTADGSLGTRGANDYCDCLLKKIIQDYPDPDDADKASKTYLNKLSSDCLRR